jgi:hypothetical protein
MSVFMSMPAGMIDPFRDGDSARALLLSLPMPARVMARRKARIHLWRHVRHRTCRRLPARHMHILRRPPRRTLEVEAHAFQAAFLQCRAALSALDNALK